jgi:hypothetical protein
LRTSSPNSKGLGVLSPVVELLCSKTGPEFKPKYHQKKKKKKTTFIHYSTVVEQKNKEETIKSKQIKGQSNYTIKKYNSADCP